MLLGEILERVRVELGGQTTFYPAQEIIESGINPAQRLICLAYPLLLQKRLAMSVNPDQVFNDLRLLTPTIRRVNRVVLGDVTEENAAPTSTTGELGRLRQTTVGRLAGRRDWIAHQGITTHYWMHGAYWLGLWRRPMDVLTITVIYDAIPAVLSIEDLHQLPDLSAVYHPTIAAVAAGLLLLKEGAPETTRGLARMTEALGGLRYDNVRRSA